MSILAGLERLVRDRSKFESGEFTMPLPMTPTITAFERSPDRGKGLARDTRVRWALEEVGQPYEVRLVSFDAMKEPAHLALHPFGKIPTYEEGDLALFETGAIVLFIAEHHAGLLPKDANARARAITWMFAALNTVEPPILELANARLLEGDKPWSKERLPLVVDRVRKPLHQLSARLGDADWLDGAFSGGDLMMVSVLLRLKPSGILDEFPKLSAYVARGEARPSYQRAFAAQLAAFTDIAAVKETYAAINRNDVPAAVNAFDPQVEWIEPPDFPTPGTYRGHAEVMAHISRGRNTWAEGGCDLERFIVAGDKIVAFVRARVRLKDHTEWIDGPFADVHTFRDGKVIQVRSFGKRQEALDWAGAKGSEAT
jgi:glutathione S-transferase